MEYIQYLIPGIIVGIILGSFVTSVVYHSRESENYSIETMTLTTEPEFEYILDLAYDAGMRITRESIPVSDTSISNNHIANRLTVVSKFIAPGRKKIIGLVIKDDNHEYQYITKGLKDWANEIMEL